MKATPFLMFQGQAKDALALYRETFPDYEELLARYVVRPGERTGRIRLVVTPLL